MKSPALTALFWGAALAAIDLNINDAASIKTAAASVAKNLLTYYTGTQPGQTPGILPGPPPAGDYYWWEAGAMWNTLIDYWRATGDATYNDLVAQGILFQIGPGDNFMPPNQTASLGNDDQGIWGMAALAAAETGLSNPSDDPRSQWLVLARNVFDDLAARWDDSDSADQCGGGLRWQIAAANQGYDYKNSMSTGTLFNLAVRLARLTGNATYYGEWAERTWGWMETVGFLDKETGAIYDGAHVQNNCSDVNRARFSYVLGTFVQGAANMYNATDAGAAWRDRLSTLVNGTDVFTGDDCVPVESACEAEGTCTTDMRAFKGILLRGLAVSAAQAPFTAGRLGCVLEGAATAVAASCDDAGDEGARCGFVWTEGRDDGARGAGEQMNALAALAARYEILAGAGGVGNGTAGGNGSSSSGGGGSGSGSGSGSGTGSGNATQSGGAPAATSAGGKSGAGVTADRAGLGFVVVGAVVVAGLTALLA